MDASFAVRSRDLSSPGMESPVTPVCRPRLPPAKRIMAYLERVDETRHYTNYGELSELLRKRLTAFFEAGEGTGMLASSGTAGLIGAILATAGRARPEKPYCICPAFTFVATAVAAVSCGYEPYIVDVDPETWALDPAALRNLPALKRAGVIIPVAPLGRAPDLDAWQAFQDETGIDVVMDAAACFDTLDPEQVKRCRFPVVVSLHATKTLSTAEGGLVLCGSTDTASRVMRALNFGFYYSRNSVGPSINGKLSEYHAAVGLADLDTWEEKRAGFLRVAASYREAAIKYDQGPLILTDTANANPYAHFLAPDRAAAERAIAALERVQFDTRRWYSAGLQSHSYFESAPRTAVPVTEDILPRLVGLPCACDLDAEKIDRIVQIISDA